MTTVAQYAAQPGSPGVKKQWIAVYPASRSSTSTNPVGFCNQAPTVISKISIIMMGAGSSPVETFAVQYQVAGSAAVAVADAVTPTYATNGAIKDVPITVSSVRNAVIPAAAIVEVVIAVTSGTLPIAMVVIDYFEDDGNHGN